MHCEMKLLECFCQVLRRVGGGRAAEECKGDGTGARQKSDALRFRAEAHRADEGSDN